MPACGKPVRIGGVWRIREGRAAGSDGWLRNCNAKFKIQNANYSTCPRSSLHFAFCILNFVQLYPVFLKLSGRPVLLVGGGTVAAAKLDGLLSAGALVTVVAPEINASIARPGVTLLRRGFNPGDLDGVWWVVAAAPPDVNRQVQAAAESKQLFVNRR